MVYNPFPVDCSQILWDTVGWLHVVPPNPHLFGCQIISILATVWLKIHNACGINIHLLNEIDPNLWRFGEPTEMDQHII